MKIPSYFKTLAAPLLSIAMAGVSIDSFAQGQEVEESARGIVEKYKSSIVVVTVKGSLEATTTGKPLPSREQNRRTLGVTIADNGLIVVSNTAIDASVGLAGQQAKVDDKIVKIQSAKSIFSEVEISYGDATLIHGEVVRQDVEADVAFILPDVSEAKALKKTTFDKVDLTQFAAAAKIADRVVALSRSSAVYGYMPTLNMGRITGIFKRDRTFFVTTAGTAQGLPIFTMDGKPIGITVMRIIDGKPSGVLGTLSAGSIQVMANLAQK